MHLLSHTFGINHATVTTPILYQTTYLGKHLGNIDNAILYLVTMFTALFLASTLNDLVGGRRGLTASMLGYTVYVFLFAVALLFTSDPDDPSEISSALAIVGAFLGGVAAGPLWTFQGVVVSQIVQTISDREGLDEADVSSELWGTFGLSFLGWEFVMRAATTGLLKLNVGKDVIFFIFAAFALASSLAWHFFTPAGCDPPPTGSKMTKKVAEAISLWGQGKLWLLQFTNLTFGFAAAWNASYVGPHFTSVALSSEVIGFTGALISLIGGVGSRALAPIAKNYGKSVIILVGSMSFFGIGLLSKILKSGEGMGWGVLIFPILMGIGRAVYESTNKGVFNDFYPAAETRAGVFANVMVFGTLSSSIVFILDLTDQFQLVIILLIAFSVCTFPCIYLAGQMKSREDAEAGKKVRPFVEDVQLG